MALLPFATGTRAGRSLAVDTEHLSNVYPELTPKGKAVVALHARPGLVEWLTPTPLPSRGLHEIGADIYSVHGGEVYRITPDGAVTLLFSLNTIVGLVSMANNNTQLMIVDGQDGWIWNYSTLVFAQITDAEFPAAPQHVTYLDGFFVVSVASSGTFYKSGADNGLAWDGTEFATAETAPDALATLIASRGELFLFGFKSIEVWQNVGAADFPFRPLRGAHQEHGILAPWSLTCYAGSCAWLGRRAEDGGPSVYRFNGYIPQRISAHWLEHHLESYSVLSDAVGFAYGTEGHVFYVLIFPTVGKAWAYDLASDQWHELVYEQTGRFRGLFYARNDKFDIVSDYETGKLYRMKLDQHTDDGALIHCKVRNQVISESEQRLVHRAIQVVFEPGVGLVTGQGSDPQAMLRWSNDGGNSWGNEIWRDIGQSGEYQARAVWRRLGVARNRVYELTITDPVKRVITGIVPLVEGLG